MLNFENFGNKNFWKLSSRNVSLRAIVAWGVRFIAFIHRKLWVTIRFTRWGMCDYTRLLPPADFRIEMISLKSNRIRILPPKLIRIELELQFSCLMVGKEFQNESHKEPQKRFVLIGSLQSRNVIHDWNQNKIERVFKPAPYRLEIPMKVQRLPANKRWQIPFHKGVDSWNVWKSFLIVKLIDNLRTNLEVNSTKFNQKSAVNWTTSNC